MMFGHWWAVWLAALPLLWAAYSWRDSSRKSSLSMKALSLTSILLAFSEPAITVPETKTAALILVDTSGSIGAEDLQRQSALVSSISSSIGRNWLHVIPFAAHTRDLRAEETAGPLRLVRGENASGGGTNIEAALTESLAAIPAGYVPRIVLMSDGNENQGSTVRAIAQLGRLHVPVDTVALVGHAGSLRLLSVSMPQEGYAGEAIPIDLTVDSPSGANVSVTMSAEGKALGTDSAKLKPGKNTLRVHARVESTGVVALSGEIRSGDSGEASFERAIHLKRAHVLYLSQDPPGTESNLLLAFKEADYDVTNDGIQIAKGLSETQLVVLNNLDLETLGVEQKAKLEEYVSSGGGLLLIGGERQVYKADKLPDALDRLLPAKLVPPQTPEGICVVLIIDKSSSMEGRKIELARLSASGVVDHLRPTDSIGILIFDNSFQWAVPMRRALDKPQIKRLISGISPDGGTQIAPALGEAYRRVSLSNASSKHIVLLTDGISEEGDSVELAKEALLHQVTISTVGLGQDVNRSYLEKVAGASGGKSYFLNEPQGLEQILLKDVQDYSGKTTIEKDLEPQVRADVEILDGVQMESAPALKGYTRFSAKPGAETILGINEEKKDPLYVRWQYGLGRVGVFTSDAKSRWAEAWVTWPGFDKFWINVTRDLLTHGGETAATAAFDNSNNDLLVTYQLAAGAAAPSRVPPMYVLGPNGFHKPILVERTSPLTYRGHLHVDQPTGLFRVRPAEESGVFPEVGVYGEDQESRDSGANEMLLRELASATGGRFNPAPESVFNAPGRTLYTTWQLWPFLLGLAIVLTVAELIARKWSGLVQARQWRFQRSI